jgi:type III pantothenate kinase
MSGSLLLVDAGNTRVKWARVAGRNWEARGVCGYRELDGLAAAAHEASSGQCWIASVAGQPRDDALAGTLTGAGMSLHWLEARQAQCGVSSYYDPPSQLGVDRWVALLAARRRCREACVVVSAGTALTVDALNADGHFLGGFIVAGKGLMERALSLGTARVGESAGRAVLFPCNTADAVRSGLLVAMAGAVSAMRARLREAAGAEPRCLLTGGDAEVLASALPFAAEQVPDLALEGILLAASAAEGR